MGLQPIYGKGLHPSLWAGSQPASDDDDDDNNNNNNNNKFTIYRQFTSTAAGRMGWSLVF